MRVGKVLRADATGVRIGSADASPSMGAAAGSSTAWKTVVVQASSRSWQGARDLCMNPVGGVPAVRATVLRFLEADPDLRVVLAAPGADRGGEFEELFEDLPVDRFEIVYAADASPLERLLVATCDLAAEDVFLRVDGLHFAVLVEVALGMLSEAEDRHLDLLKFPDDFPVQFSADVYRVGALRALQCVDLAPGFEVHPKYALIEDQDGFATARIDPPAVSDDALRDARERARDLYRIRSEVTGRGIGAGDQLAFHYEFACEHLPGGSRVLDIASGNGFGTRLLESRGFDVLGGDVDPDVVARAKEAGGASFEVLDGTALDLASSSFDAVVSMETIEHLDPETFLREVSRVLRPGGLLVLSTPQNALGHIPVNPEHSREFSLEEIVELCGAHFEVLETVGIKQGRIVLPGSPLGTNTLLVARKR